ncbi:MAG: hypothetical protein ACEQSR_00940 [Candidatus Methylacidiphilales bacterium]
MENTKEELTEQLNVITVNKMKAVAAQSYELASMYRDKEKDLILKLEELENNKSN